MKNDQSCCAEQMEHPDHSKELHRLNRVRGQLDGIVRMIEERRYCPDIITQIQAVRSALSALQKGILERHLKGCVQKSFSAKDQKTKDEQIEELLSLFAKL